MTLRRLAPDPVRGILVYCRESNLRQADLLGGDTEVLFCIRARL
jgi:hypothetical protein